MATTSAGNEERTQSQSNGWALMPHGPQGMSTRHTSWGLYSNLLWEAPDPICVIFELSSLQKGKWKYYLHWPTNTEQK